MTGDGIYSYDYDSENRLIEVSYGGSAIAKYYYDYAGRRIAKVTANVTTTYCYDGDQVIAEYEDGTLKRKFIYGRRIDEPIIMIDVAASKYYYYHFDGLGSVVDPDGINQVTEYSYDSIGRLKTISGYTDDTDNDTKQTTYYDFNNLGLVEKITYPDSSTIEYAYDEAGNVTTRTDQKGWVTSYSYDDVYNMTQKQVTVGGVTTTESFAYDALGRTERASKIEGASSISVAELAYNDIGKVTDANQILFGGTRRKINYSYDQAGFLTSTTYPDGSTTVDITPDWAGRIDTITRDPDVANDDIAYYDYIGSRVARRTYNTTTAINSDYSYDNLGRVTKIKSYLQDSSDIAHFTYTYVDGTDNIDTQTYVHRSNSSSDFDYDNLDRLSVATYIDDSNEVFTMDDLGNRLEVNLKDGSDEVYDVNDIRNQYMAIDDSSLEYDAAGNLIKDKNGYLYTYDYENRIIEIKD